eukprot:gene12837-15072_t
MSGTSDWKKELLKASRTTVVNISNETEFILQRVSVKLQQGLLRLFPPEIIGPGSKVEFASESNAFVTGTKGSVVYLVLPPAVAPIQSNSVSSLSAMIAQKLWEPFLYVTIEWSNPYWTTHSCSVSGQAPIETKYYLSHEEINRQIHSEVKVVIKGRSIQFKVSKSAPSSPSSTPASPAAISPVTPAATAISPPMSPARASGIHTSTLSFFSSISAGGAQGAPGFPLPWASSGAQPDTKDNWKHAVRRATRGQFVTIVNKTSRLLIRRDYLLEHGSWAELPPEGIPAGASIEFGTASGLCAGTDGCVNYYSNGLKGDFKFAFNNPFIGENTFSHHCPPTFSIERQVVPGTISYVIFSIVDKALPAPPSPVAALAPAATPKEPDDGIRIVTLNLGLLCDHLTSVEERTETIAKSLVNLPEKYDIICLQEVFKPSAKERLTRVLRPHYAYIVEKSGEDSGLYFASTFPILWSDFRLFNEGIGMDVHASKGVQGVKLDLSSVKEGAVLYVFNAHLQSNPDSSVAWQMVAGDDKTKKAQTVRTLQLQSIRDFISTELTKQSANLKKVGLILCGDMNIVGEAEQLISDEGSAILSQVVPELAKQINNREITATFSHQILDHLAANNVPLRYLGILRAQLHNPRMKSLLLTEMISFIIKKQIVELLSQRHNQMPSSINDDEATYRTIVLETLNRVFHYDTKASTEYWTSVLKGRLRAEFSSALTELESMDFVDLRAHVINLQLVTSLKNSLELTLPTKSIYQLVKGARFNVNLPAPLIVSDNIEELILPPLTSYWGIDNNSDISYISSIDKLNLSGGSTGSLSSNGAPGEEENRIKIYLKPTDEYESFQKILGHPVDLFRVTNPHLPGYTIHQSLNQMVTRTAVKERIDYIFSFSHSPNYGDDDGRNNLLHLHCIESSIIPMGTTPQTRMSDHFAVDRLVLPLTVEEYQVAQLYMVAKKSKESTKGGESIEILKNEPYENEKSKGQFTHKVIHLNNSLPKLAASILPSSALKVEERAWNAYPYCKTEYFVLGCDEETLKKRVVDFIDIANDPVETKDYVKEEDPKLFKSAKTGRGPLVDPNWRANVVPVMTCYKLVHVEFRYFGFQTKVENLIQKLGVRDVLFKAHRALCCWMDEWYGLTIEDIRKIEAETKEQIARALEEQQLQHPPKK